jgi:phosphonate transport system substrate-binding protein
MRNPHLARARLLLPLVALALIAGLAGCGSDDDAGAQGGPEGDGGTLRIGAIPDQDPEKLARSFGLVADHVAATLGVEVEYVPVADYAAAVSLFRTGDLDLVWFGGLTGVQARLETPGAEVVAQRDIDEEFHSVFIASADAGIDPVDSVEELDVFDGRRFTFGSESSTSGRLMPQYFLDQAGLDPESVAGEPGYSGSHDRTIELVASGSFEAGVLNEQVWRDRLADGSVDRSQVVEVFRTPSYHDYHWLLHPSTGERYGAEFEAEVREALTSLSADDPGEAEILELFGAGAFVPSAPENYTEIEQIGRKLGLITD